MIGRALYFKNFKTGEIAGAFDVNGRADREIEKIMCGMAINCSDEWLVSDTDLVAGDEAIRVIEIVKGSAAIAKAKGE